MRPPVTTGNDRVGTLSRSGITEGGAYALPRLDSETLRFYPGDVIKSVGGSAMATLVRWPPFSELASLQNELSRFMNGLHEGNGRTAQSWIPTADVWETENDVVYAFDLPGIGEDEISVELEDGALTVTAERE